MTRAPLGAAVKPSEDGAAPSPAVTTMPSLSKSELFHFENICWCFECIESSSQGKVPLNVCSSLK